jgi:hypothetical protein
MTFPAFPDWNAPTVTTALLCGKTWRHTPVWSAITSQGPATTGSRLSSGIEPRPPCSQLDLPVADCCRDVSVCSGLCVMCDVWIAHIMIRKEAAQVDDPQKPPAAGCILLRASRISSRQDLCQRQVRTTARMAAFIPGASPPLVSTATRFIVAPSSFGRRLPR